MFSGNITETPAHGKPLGSFFLLPPSNTFAKKLNERGSCRIEFLNAQKKTTKAHEHFITSTMSKPNDFQNHHTPDEPDLVCDDRNDRSNNHVGDIPLGRKRRQLSNDPTVFQSTNPLDRGAVDVHSAASLSTGRYPIPTRT
jgi:hypothetical protein